MGEQERAEEWGDGGEDLGGARCVQRQGEREEGERGEEEEERHALARGSAFAGAKSRLSCFGRWASRDFPRC